MNISTSNKRVLIYGDSITWGRIALKTGRYDSSTRWTCLVQKQLGDNVEIIEEGLRARMLAGENPYFKDRDGLRQFGPILGSHLPLALVVLFLGTNDMNKKNDKSPELIATKLTDYIDAIKKWSEEMQFTELPKVLIISPPLIDESRLRGETMFDGGGIKSRKLGQLYKTIAYKHGAQFFDAGQAVNVCEEDGIHLDAVGNATLASELTPVIKDILFH